MKEKINAVKISLRILLNRIDALKITGKVYYELEQKVKEFSDKIYEMGDILEEIEVLLE